MTFESEEPGVETGGASAESTETPGGGPEAKLEAVVTGPPIVLLGASAGGLEALELFLSALPPDTGATFVTVMHLSPDFKSLMPELLARHTTMRVQTLTDGTEPEANTIYIIPPSYNIVLRDARLMLELQDRTPGHALNLPIDVFLRSLAAELGTRTIAIILSGTGSDGSRGARVVKDAGGLVLVQEPSTAKFPGMPQSAIDTGIVDVVASPAELAQLVARVVRDGGLQPPAAVEHEDDAAADDMIPVVDALREQLSLDLGYLRTTMLRRRVRRRMLLQHVDTLPEYVDILRSDAAEARALSLDTYIGVTAFFRDAEAFRRLQKHLATDLLRRGADEQFRVWVTGCATGEEVYSLAITILEAMEAGSRQRTLKIFATDVDEESLARASKGVYPLSAVADVGPVRLARYFVTTGENVVVKPFLRECVIFANHNVVTQPPFTRIDLVSCRNLLIYLTEVAQEAVLSSLHFALRRDGTLFLGSAEALGRLESEFEVIDPRFRLFRKLTSGTMPWTRVRSGLRDPQRAAIGLAMETRERRYQREREREAAHRQVVEVLTEGRGVTAAILGTDGVLLDLIGDPLGVFRMPKGRRTDDVMRLVVDEIRFAISNGIQALRRGDDEARIAVEIGEPARYAMVRMARLPALGLVGERILFLVEPTRGTEARVTERAGVMELGAAARLTEIENELQQTRESLQATIEELQSSNEEQQSTNEELVASNEELQSTNEELQSVNEELFTVNLEYQNKMQEQAVLTADLDNLLRNINVATLFLDRNLAIRKFTPAIEEMVKLVDHDMGRSIEHFAHHLGEDLVDDVRRVIDTARMIERECRSPRGSWLLRRVLPYVSHTGAPEGVVVTFVDVTPVRNAHQMTQVVNEQLAHANHELSRQRAELEDMISIVAHDLKRPVLALDGLLTLAQRDRGGEEGAGLLARGVAECQRMKHMLLDLETISGMRSRPIVLDETDVQPWLDAFVDRFRATAVEKGARVNCTADNGRVTIPRNALEEALTNLLENAFKYGCTAAQPRVDVSCRLADDVLELTVGDNGQGIAAEHQQRVFEPFRRLDPEVVDGSGIGLVAARRIVAHCAGTLTLESVAGAGAKFTIRIPIGGSSRHPVQRRPRVLLVEDDLLDAKMVERWLRESFQVTRAQEIGEAETRLRDERFDVMLLDLSLPDGHGLELAQRVRTSLAPELPIVVLTGHGEGLVPEALGRAISGYVSKSSPITQDTLRDAMARALAGRSASGMQTA